MGTVFKKQVTRFLPAGAELLTRKGEQFLDLRPRNGRSPYLHNGSVIPASRTSLPVSTQDLLVNLDRLLFPASGHTKAQLLHYYAQVAPALLPHSTGQRAPVDYPAREMTSPIARFNSSRTRCILREGIQVEG